MGRWSFILLGGDISNAKVRGILIRLGVISFLAGLVSGYFAADDGQGLRPLFAAGIVAYGAYLVWELRELYLKSDELARAVLQRGLAIGGALTLFGVFVYGAGEFAFGWPHLDMLRIGIAAIAAHSIGWFVAAIRAT